MIAEALRKSWQAISETEGVGNPFQQFETLSWILALKLITVVEAEEKAMLELSGESFETAFEANLSPTIWLEKDRGFTGNDLILFVRDQFFPQMAQRTGQGRIDQLLRAVFSNARLYPQSGYKLREALDYIFNLDLSSGQSRTQLSQDYERLIDEYIMKLPKPMRFYTSRPLVRAIAKMLNIGSSERVYDPAFGTAGFLIEAFRKQMEAAGGNLAAIQRAHKNISGIEKDPLQFLIGLTSFIAHGLLTPQLARSNALQLDVRQLNEDQKYDVVVCNPTFDSEEDTRNLSSNFPIATESVELLFLQHVERSLKNPGRGAVLLPEGVLFNSSNAHQQVRRELLSRVNLHSIVSLPAVGVKTSLLLFSRPGPTQNIWMYSLRLHEGVKLTQKSSFQDVHFEDLLEHYISRDNLPNARTVRIQDLTADYNLSVSSYMEEPTGNKDLLEPEEYLEQIDRLLDQSKLEVGELRRVLETP